MNPLVVKKGMTLTGSIDDYPEGIVVPVDKPYRWTSADVIRKVKWMAIKHFGKKNLKVGHAGTLDPLATGVRLVCIGKATKLADEFQAHPKEYVGFYRDNLADYGFTMNGQVTQLLARLQLISVLGRGSEGRFTPLPEDVTAYEECWKHLDAHPVVLAPELVIRSSVSGSGNDRVLGGNIDTSKMTTRQITVPPEGQKKNGSQDSRVIRRKK